MVSHSKPHVLLDAAVEHQGRLYRYLRRRLHNEQDAQDLAQEVFLRLLRVTRADLVADPQAYLYRVARNLVYEQNCRIPPANNCADDTELAKLVDPQLSPETAADRATSAALIERVMSELSPRNQAILLLFCQRGLSQREIADQVGLSKSMVQKCLSQALTHCRKRLRSLWETQP